MHHHHHHGHHHHHAHGEEHQHDHSSTKNILIALALNLSFAVIEIFGGIWTGSVAIISDALHDFGDSISLGIAYVFERIAAQDSNERYSYGYRRYSLLSAVITAIVLTAGSVWVIAEAIERLQDPVQPKTGGMAVLAILGIAVNGFAAWRMFRGTTQNEKVLSWHLVEDVLGWVVILISAIVMSFKDIPILDPVLSILFTAFILWGVIKSLRSSFGLFMQAAPEGFDIEQLQDSVASIKGVSDLHDVHFWSLDGRSHVMTMHAVVPPETTLVEVEVIKREARVRLQKFGNIHLTMEIETSLVDCPDLNCVKS